MIERSSSPSFWRTVTLLLGSARRRSVARGERARQLLQQRSGREATDWGVLGRMFFVLFMIVLNGMGAFLLRIAVESAQRSAAEQQGRIVVSRFFLEAVQEQEKYQHSASSHRRCYELNGKTYCYDAIIRPPEPPDYYSEARRITDEYGGSPSAVEQKLREGVQKDGASRFILKNDASPGMAAIATSGRFAGMIGSLVLLWWGVMLVCQGEGLDLDLQRRRHPMWEWLFSHPVKPGAVFLAEMLSPIAANPMYWGAPIFVGIVYSFIYDIGLGTIAALVIGVPVTIAAACMGKALEIGITLRFPARSRGAIIGIMSWLGYASMMFILLGFVLVPRVVSTFEKFAGIFTIIPWPWLRLFLGGRTAGSFSFLSGMVFCWIISGATLAASVRFSVWGTQKGLAGQFGQADAGPSASRKGAPRFGREPLYRKEFLWFVRDRSAVVQAILIPLTVAGFQLFNLRGLLNYAQGAWNYLCGVAILFGTYFLWVLGVGSSRVDLQACKLEYSIVSPK